MQRREFLTLLGGATVAWPFAAHAQLRKLPTIGFLGATSASAARDWSASFVQRLRELGWIEGQTVTIEYRWAEGREARFGRSQPSLFDLGSMSSSPTELQQRPLPRR